MSVLALDLATNTGFAFGGPDKGHPTTGVWRLPSIEDPVSADDAYAALFKHIAELHALERFVAITVEAPLPTGAHVNGSARKSNDLAVGLITLPGIVGCFCRLQDPKIEVFAENIRTIRKHFVGHGLPKHPKQAVMARCAQLGWRVQDHNAADAAALWCFEMSVRYPQWAPQGTPLFASRSAA